jgi:hypothetical protein
MDWLKTIRIYWPAAVTLGSSFIAMALFAPLKANPLTAGMYDLLKCLPIAGVGFGVFYGGWITWRLIQAERGEGHICPRCSGPLGFEKHAPFSPHRTCLACGKHANERHYR